MLFLLALVAPLALIGLAGGGDDDDVAPEVTETDGTDGNDTLLGGDGNDLILGFEGDDVLTGNDGADMLCSGEGDDFVSGNFGQDTIEGQGGDDWADGGYSNDGVFGDEGNDTLIGGRGIDTVQGGEGDDVLFGGILRGVPLEEDELLELADGTSLADVLSDQELDIDLREDDRMDFIEGGAGNDQIFLGNTDVALGGEGADTFNLTLDDDNSETPLARIVDYRDGEDSITIVFDAPLDVSDVTVTQSGGDAIIMANGVELALVNGAANTLSADDIAILTEDSIVGLFDPNAAAPAA